MDPLEIIGRYYRPDSELYRIFVSHSQMVAEKALRIATGHPELEPDLEFVRVAAMLHDIGIFQTAAPMIGCNGRQPYVVHGILGRNLLERLGMPRHAMVCERHVGVGLTAGEIADQGLPLPLRDMLPETIEEKIICYADKFFSKVGSGAEMEMPLEKVLKKVERYGPGPLERFTSWARLFGDL